MPTKSYKNITLGKGTIYIVDNLEMSHLGEVSEASMESTDISTRSTDDAPIIKLSTPEEVTLTAECKIPFKTILKLTYQTCGLWSAVKCFFKHIFHVHR